MFMLIHIRRLSVGFMLIILLISFSIMGHSVIKLQAGLESLSSEVLSLANRTIENIPVPKPITEYLDFKVAVSADITITVYARERKDAKANVFMVHGAGGGAWAWEYYFAHMPESYNLYALSWRGHFDSSAIGDANATDYVTDQSAVLSFIQSRNNLPTHLIGHSYGGATSVLQASNTPEKIASLTLLAPVVPLDYTFTQRLVIPKIAPFFIELSNNIEGTYNSMFLAKSRMRRYHELYAGKSYSEEKPSLIADNGVSPKWQETLRKAYEDIANQGIPLSIIIARYDNVVVPHRQYNIAQRIGANIIELESGHYIPLDTLAQLSTTIVTDILEQQ